MKQYWPEATHLDNGKCCHLFTSDSVLSEEAAKTVIRLWMQNFNIVTAWIEDDENKVIWHSCFVDFIGNRRR